ncbi:FadR/GntR family transcriptional regulator [Pimelobacter simplex]|uniref:FadR family transcriptional regulator n=1 Tax=Nocardioides simplex TaxID=2045 RepID=A0A7J5DSB2_NOCSI|nr:FadR/GntR family transcriptional regulator [Pimelobacter simplex]KAB2807845.1 FadR family transcriptional regulator [Pimelobacter simplex]
MTSPSFRLDPVRQIAAHELVLDQLRRSMESGQFRPGDTLPSERDLAEMLKVSRTVVRAAIAVLERDGLIEVRRGRGGGFIVQAPTYDPVEARRALRANKVAVRDAFDYRVIVEGAAAGLAAQRRKAAEMAELRKLMTSMEAALHASLEDQTPHKVVEFQALDSAFHLGIARAARNPGLYDAVSDARRKMWLPVGAIFGHLEENANDRHEDILKAIEDGDAALASSTMEAHINDTRHTLEAWLKR